MKVSLMLLLLYLERSRTGTNRKAHDLFGVGRDTRMVPLNSNKASLLSILFCSSSKACSMPSLGASVLFFFLLLLLLLSLVVKIADGDNDDDTGDIAVGWRRKTSSMGAPMSEALDSRPAKSKKARLA